MKNLDRKNGKKRSSAEYGPNAQIVELGSVEELTATFAASGSHDDNNQGDWHYKIPV